MRNKFQSLLLAAVLLVVPGLVVFTSASPAAAADAACSGTVTSPCLFHNFEIDGDTSVDGGGIDWASPPVAGSAALTNFTDLSGSGSDNGFQGSSKENNQSNWSCTNSPQAAKDDLTKGQIWFQTVNGVQYIYGDFYRVSGNGDAHIDYEFNKLSTGASPSCSNLPARSNGDILIAFDATNGGSTITVTAYKFSGGSFTQIADSTNQFAGLANVAPARSDSGQAAGTFGEAGLDLTDTVGTFSCGEFGAAYMKTRSSTSISSGLMDYTNPQKINTGNCPKSTLVKGVRDITTNTPANSGTTVNYSNTSVPASPGDKIGYQLAYTNSGAAQATNVVISDPIPAGETADTTSCVPATCTLTGSTLSWPATTVAAGGSLTYTFSATLGTSFSSGTTPVNNTANVATTEEGNTPSNQTTVNVNATNGLSITKTADNSGAANGGDTIGYTITLSNTGNQAVSGAKITDSLPGNAGLNWSVDTGSASSANAGTICSITGTPPAAQSLACNIGALAAGGSFHVHITSPTTQATCANGGTVSNTATGSSTTPALSVQSGSPAGTPTTITISCPASKLTKTVNDDTSNPGGTGSQGPINASPGDQLTYTVTYLNNGQAPATNVAISDPFPSATGVTNPVTFVSCTNSCTHTSSSVSWPTVASVAPGVANELSYSFTVKLASTFPTGSTPVTNTAVVTTTQTGTTSSNQVTVNVAGSAVLGITKTADNSGAANGGDTIGYTITLSNTGNTGATNAKITDSLPGNAGLNWSVDTSSLSSPNAGTLCTITGTPPAAQSLACNIGTLAANSSFHVHITSPTTQATCANNGTVNNTASGSADGGLSVQSGSPAGTPTTITVSCPHSVLTKTVNDDTSNPGGTGSQGPVNASPGDQLTYTVTYLNNGQAPATNVAISDPFPTATGVTSPVTFVSCTNSCTHTSSSVSWPTVASVAPGVANELTYSFTVKLASTFPQGTTPVTNTAVVTTTQTGSTSSNQVTVNVGASGALSITKTADNSGAANGGDTIGYTITVNDGGNSDATHVQITDTLPSNAGLNWSIDASSASSPNAGTLCSIVGTALTCNVPTVAAGSSFHVHITSPTTQATCANGGTVSNTASVTADGGLSAQSGSPAGTPTTITVSCPNSVLTKTVHDDTADPGDNVLPSQGPIGASAGDQLTYTITYLNNGQAPATNVAISDPFPIAAGVANPVSFVSCTNSCSHDSSGVSWPTVASVAPGVANELSYSFTVQLAPTFPQGTTHVTNTAVVTTTQTGSTSSNQVTVNVGAGSVLGLTKTADNSGAANGGDTIGYTITVSATGTSDATNVQVTDTLPSNAGLNWSIDTGSASSPNAGTICNIVGTALTCNIPTLTANTSFHVHITSPTTQATCANGGTVSNTASATADGGLSAQSGSPAGTPTTITVSCPASQLTKTVNDDTTNPGGTGSQGPISASPGDQLTYTVTYLNSGNAPATNVAISDPFPTATGVTSPVTFVSCTNSCTHTSSSVSWPTVASVAPGVANELSYSFTVKLATAFPQGTTPVTNTAVVTTTQTGTTSSNPVVVNVGSNVVLGISKTADSATANDTDTIGYTISVSNTGNSDATNATISDTLPTNAGLSWSIDTGTKSSPNAGTLCQIASGKLTCNLGTLAAGASFHVHITSPTTQATCASGGTVSNTAKVTADGGLSAQSGSPAGTPTVITVNCAAVNLSKTADNATVASGQQVGYTLTVTNTGAGDAYNVVVSDTLPNSIAGLNWHLAAPVTGCSVSSANPQVLTCNLGTVPAGSAPIVIDVVSSTPANTCGSLTNSASVTSSNGGGNTVNGVTITVPLSTAGASTDGSAYGLDVSAIGLHLINQLGLVNTSAPGPNGGPHATNLLTVPSILGVVSANVVNNLSTSTVNTQATSTATSEIAGVSLLGGAIKADAIEGVSQSVANGTTATYNGNGSTFTNLQINGKSVTNVTPNTNVTVYLPGTKIIVAKAVLDEQSGTSGLSGGMWSSSEQTTMIDITLVQGLGTLPAGAKILVVHAQSDATFPSSLGCGATANTVSGNAYIAYANGTLLNTTLVNAQVGDAELPSTGGSDSDHVANVTNLGSLVAAGAADDSTTGQTTGNPITASSGANVANVNLLGGLVKADAIDVKASSSATHTSGTTSYGASCTNITCPRGCATSSPCFVNLVVGGVTIVGANGGTVPPNTVIALPQSDGSLVEVILNEQIPAGGANSTTTGNTQGDINAIHVYVLKNTSLLNAEVIVAHAHSDAHHI